MNIEKTIGNVNKGMLYGFTAIGAIGILFLVIGFLTTPFRFVADGFTLAMIWLCYWILKRMHKQYKETGSPWGVKI